MRGYWVNMEFYIHTYIQKYQILFFFFSFKVCNHPELFERREAKSPLFVRCPEYILPKLLFDDGLLYLVLPSKHHLLYNHLSIFAVEYIQRSLFPLKHSQGTFQVFTLKNVQLFFYLLSFLTSFHLEAICNLWYVLPFK